MCCNFWATLIYGAKRKEKKHIFFLYKYWEMHNSVSSDYLSRTQNSITQFHIWSYWFFFLMKSKRTFWNVRDYEQSVPGVKWQINAVINQCRIRHQTILLMMFYSVIQLQTCGKWRFLMNLQHIHFVVSAPPCWVASA